MMAKVCSGGWSRAAWAMRSALSLLPLTPYSASMKGPMLVQELQQRTEDGGKVDLRSSAPRVYSLYSFKMIGGLQDQDAD